MRTYQDIWQKLKSNKTNVVRVAAPKAIHRRIKKAVTKEKDQDILYKLILQDTFKKAILKTVSEVNILVFTLTFHDDLKGTTAKDLFS